MKKITAILTFAIFASFSWQSNAQESCANAMTLTPGTAQAGDSTGQVGDFPNAGGAPENPCNAFYNDDEYWFEYTAVETGEKLQLDLTDITQNYAGLFVLDNCPDTTPTCVSSATNGFSNADLSFETAALTAGTSYKIVVASWGTPDNTAFTLNSTVIAAPTCPDTENITASNNLDGTVSLDWDDSTGAAGYNYEIQPQGTAQGTAGALVMDASVTSEAAVASGVLTDGDDYTLFVQTDCGTGNLGAFASVDFTYNIPPVNDTCAGVIDLDNETSPLSGSTIGASNDFVLDCLTNVASPDVIYSITVPDTYILNFEQTVNDYDSKVRIAHGATCPGDILVVCYDDPDTGAQEWTNDTGAEVEVYITIAAFSTGSGTFTFEYSVTAPPTCPEVENFAVANITETGADFTWDEVTEATVGYNLNIFNAGDDPTTATAVDTQAIAAGTLTATTTLLTASTSYDAYIQSDCDAAGVSLDAMITFTTANTPPPPPVCGGKFYDTGGPDGDFMNSEDYQVTISPDNAGDVVTASFVFVDNAGGTFDTLTVDVGDGTFVLVPDVALGDTPVEFTSIAADGSLVFNFVSSAVVPNAGWDADITCAAPVATCDAPVNLAVSNVTTDSADFTWDVVADATNGYTLTVFNAGDDPATATAVATETSATNSVTVTGLTQNTDYDAYVVSNCDTLDSELSTPAVTFTTEMLVGFDDNNLLNVAIFPNPTNGTVTLTAVEAVQSVSVYSVLGQEVLSSTPNSTSFEINLSNVANGTYFVKATSNGATSVIKVIKK
ncbi:fibronectin type III domain-containing protein [Patiriisocius marinus]|uniref:fibronectin type III domain-containing protein n=1 Tax=Patiriisocius marinus TaxID=1397112 RepID=UPI00232D900C|nr:fibronectin type III domain-containing protein [Patiriisocius marinus]